MNRRSSVVKSWLLFVTSTATVPLPCAGDSQRNSVDDTTVAAVDAIVPKLQNAPV